MTTQPKGRFAAYRRTLTAIAARTGTPLPSLVLSFGILHELTAVVPLVGIFYGSRAVGIGEHVVSAIIEDKTQNSANYEASAHEKSELSWGKQKLKSWVEEGDRWAIRVGRRYGIFGYEKRMPGTMDDVEEMAGVTGHIAGDVANAILAYGATKALLPILSHERHLRVSVKLQFRVVRCLHHDKSNTFQGSWLTQPSPTTWMTKNKLNLKRTPEEELQHRLGKERKRAKRSHGNFEPQPGTSSKRSHADEQDAAGPSRKWASSDEDDETEYGPQPANRIPTNSKSHAHKPDYDALKAEIEQDIFRQKMFDAMGDDERLDSIEAQFNDFAQVPDRWRTSGTGKSKVNAFEEGGYVKMDPRYMDDEEYAEWIRVGMYRKTHAEEYAEQERKKAAKAARREEEKVRQAETARLEKAAEEERKRKKRERESQRWDYAREEYGIRWRALLSMTGDTQTLGFDDIPWPVAAAQNQKPKKRQSEVPRRPIDIEELTAEAITAFLLPAGREKRKERLRESFLRFHPDKFEGRFMKFVKENEKEKVKEAIGQVSRVLNTLIMS